MRPSFFGGTGLARCSRQRSERSGLRICAASPSGVGIWMINGERCYFWRAVDHEGEVLETVVTAKRDKAAALKFLKRMMKKCGQPQSVVTDGLCSYPAAMKEIGNADRHEVGRRLNNRAEKSHQPFRRPERAMQLFRARRHYKSSAQFMRRSTIISTRNVISSPAKSTNRDARLRWPNGAQSSPDPHWEFLRAKRVP
jgi:IS1 family transposase